MRAMAWTMIGLIVVLTGLASVVPADTAAPDKDTYHGVFRFKKINRGPYGGPIVSVAAWRVEGGNSVDLLMPDRDPSNKIDDGVIKNADPGDILDVICRNAGGRTMLVSLKKYDGKLGEEDDGVFVFVKKADKKIGPDTFGAVDLTKFLQPATVLIPNVKNADGKMVPDDTIVQAVDALKSGDLAKVVTVNFEGQAMIKSIKYFDPYRRVEFQKSLKETVNNQELSSVEVSDNSKDKPEILRYTMDPQGPNFTAMAKTVAGCKLGDDVLIRTLKDDRGNWLVAIKPAEPALPKDPGDTTPPPWPNRGGRHGRL